jgi:hypothetical protein
MDIFIEFKYGSGLSQQRSGYHKSIVGMNQLLSNPERKKTTKILASNKQRQMYFSEMELS